MRLSEEEVHRIVDKLLVEWKKNKLIQFKSPESKVREKLIAVFVENLQMEDRLNKEVDQVLEKFESQFASGALDRRKMFNMVKNQLIKERKLVI